MNRRGWKSPVMLVLTMLFVALFSIMSKNNVEAAGAYMELTPDGTCYYDGHVGSHNYYVETYQFEIPQNGRVKIGVTPYNNDIIKYSLNSDRYFSVYDNIEKDATGEIEVELKAGTYYIKVEGTGYYKISVNFSAAADFDTEPNDTKETAIPLTSGVKVRGNAYRAYSDVDWYKFEIKTKSYVDIILENNRQPVYVYDANGKIVTWVIGTAISTIEKPGTYYIEVLSAHETMGYYDLKATIVEYPTPNEITSAVYKGSRKVDLTWSKSEYADGYYLFYKTSQTGKWNRLTTVRSGNTTSYTHYAGPSEGQTYYYGVQAYRLNTVFGEIWNQDDAEGFKVEAKENVQSATPTNPSANTSSASDKNSEAAVEKTILAVKNDKDISGSKFNLLQAKASKATKNSIKVTWKKVSGASKYIIYGNQCGKSYKKLKTTTAKSYTQKKLSKGKYYKYLIVAIDKNGKVIAKSKTIHAATSGGKVGNAKKVTLNKKSITLKKGKTFKLKAKAVPQSSKIKVKNHRKVAYESSNKKVATVTTAGKIKAVKKGTCYIYAYAQNGVYARIKVKVK